METTGAILKHSPFQRSVFNLPFDGLHGQGNL